MKFEIVKLTKEEIYEILNDALKLNKRTIDIQKCVGEEICWGDCQNIIFYCGDSYDYLPIIRNWAKDNDINIVIIDSVDKNDYNSDELEALKQENTVLVVKNIYHTSKEFLNRRLLHTIEYHAINEKNVFENLLFVIGIDNGGGSCRDAKLVSFFGHFGRKYIEE